MSALAYPVSAASSPSPIRFLDTLRHSEPRLTSLALLLVLCMAPTLFAMAVDARQFLGINVWDKPFKFEVALTIYLVTLAFFARYLPEGFTQRRWYRTYIGAVIAAIVAEMIWIGAAAAMATASHFNGTPAGAVVYGFMGLAAILLTSLSTVYAVLIARNRDTGLAPVVKESLVIGLTLVLPLTLVTAGTMSAAGGHFVGAATSDAGGLWLMGWSRSGGDLRVAHFFATHALHFVPLAGLASAALFGGGQRLPIRLFSVLFVAFVGYIFLEALSGRPFLPWI